MKKLIFAISLILGFSLGAFAQIEEQGGQFFGGQRAVAFNVHNFGTISAPTNYTFVINNPSPNAVVISNINIPNGVTVTVLNKKIAPKSQGKVIVTIDPKNFGKKGSFSVPLQVQLVKKLPQGIKIIEIRTYILKGIVK